MISRKYQQNDNKQKTYFPGYLKDLMVQYNTIPPPQQTLVGAVIIILNIIKSKSLFQASVKASIRLLGAIASGQISTSKFMSTT